MISADKCNTQVTLDIRHSYPGHSHIYTRLKISRLLNSENCSAQTSRVDLALNFNMVLVHNMSRNIAMTNLLLGVQELWFCIGRCMKLSKSFKVTVSETSGNYQKITPVQTVQLSSFCIMHMFLFILNISTVLSCNKYFSCLFMTLIAIWNLSENNAESMRSSWQCGCRTNIFVFLYSKINVRRCRTTSIRDICLCSCNIFKTAPSKDGYHDYTRRDVRRSESDEWIINNFEVGIHYEKERDGC